ncbi:MAG: hypothetical protein K9L17_08155 [Clostridiales bacterium]|nr:hypothetical protein [Clostridiales bacterium]MCF8022647.1 hypothetical protein [Clostridiales bacterium]
MTTSFAVYTGVGREHSTAQKIKKAAEKCKDIIRAIPTPWPGYVQVEVKASEGSSIETTSFEMPKNTKMVIEMVPGVIKIAGNGSEAVNMD